MWHSVLAEASFYELLQQEDEHSAERARLAGCHHCGGRLHSARYPRKPRGAPQALGEGYGKRLSFCCDQEGCRRRMTPPSLRFLGRRVYLAAAVIVATALRQGLSPVRVARIGELIGVDRRTLMRWRRWWLDTFIRTPLWKAGRAVISVTAEARQLPACLLDCFVGTARERLLGLLRFLAPLSTTTSNRAVAC